MERAQLGRVALPPKCSHRLRKAARHDEEDKAGRRHTMSAEKGPRPGYFTTEASGASRGAGGGERSHRIAHETDENHEERDALRRGEGVQKPQSTEMYTIRRETRDSAARSVRLTTPPSAGAAQRAPTEINVASLKARFMLMLLCPDCFVL
jgi:hypothetical protein